MPKTWVKSTVSLSLACLVLGVGLFLLGQSRSLAKSEPVADRQSNLATSKPQLQEIEITLETVATGLSRPVQVTHAGDGSGRLFVVEQGGRIKIIENGAVLGAPFLDISGLVSCCGERGLLGLAFHPNYEQNGYFYLNYTRSDGNTVIARYTVSANPNVADPASALTILVVAQPYSNHNGGQLLFSPVDGYLYIGMGDGGSGGDPDNNAQDTGTLLGAMLRLDVDSAIPYAIPPDNPYANTAGRDEIWAIGLRNPWRFSFDRATGDLYIGDVGQNAWEEISYEAAGAPGGTNFGWRCREGAHNYNFSGSCGSLTLTDPIAEYSHSEGNAVTGGFVYRGSLYAALAGRYFFADYGEGKIWSIYRTGPASWSNKALELDTTLLISSFGEDEAGELYITDLIGGVIYHLADPNGPSPNLTSSTKTVSIPHANPGETITYTLHLRNSGGFSPEIASLTDTLPTQLNYVPGTLAATDGTVDDSHLPELTWQGPLTTTDITITYQVIPADFNGSLINQAHLTGPGFEPVSLVAAVSIPRPVLTTTATDFFLPGTQPNQLAAPIPNPSGCDFCHTAPIYDSWRGSMMSQAGRDPLLWAALAVANNDAPGAGDYCLRCHTPKGWLEGRSHPADGSALLDEDIEAGVACEICHRMVDPVPSPDDEATAIDLVIRNNLTTTLPSSHVGSAMLILDPADNRRGPFAFDPALPHHTAYQTDYLGQSTNPMAEARLCGSCHNVDNPVLSWDSSRGQFWPNGSNLAAPSFEQGQLFPIETTFDEWANSDYAAVGVYAPQFAGSKPDGIVRTCQDCHLRRTTGRAADDIYNPVDRDCVTTGCLPAHQLVGGNSWVPQLLQDNRWRLHNPADAAYLNKTITLAKAMLRQAATLTVTLTTSGAQKVATVRVTNETGHKLPTGYPEGRRMWLNLRAYDAADNLVYESGAYDPATGALDLSHHPKIYEAKQGLTPELAGLLGMPAGESFHFVLNNTVIKDNRIPPRGFSTAALSTVGLEAVGETSYTPGQYWDETIYNDLPLTTTRVVAILYYQTASKEYIDFLRANGGLDGATLGTLWNSSKSPPEVMAFAADPPRPIYLPLIFK